MVRPRKEYRRTLLTAEILTVTQMSNLVVTKVLHFTKLARQLSETKVFSKLPKTLTLMMLPEPDRILVELEEVMNAQRKGITTHTGTHLHGLMLPCIPRTLANAQCTWLSHKTPRDDTTAMSH